MNIADKLGLNIEQFCRMVTSTKMLLSNVLGHVAELHYEKYLDSNKIPFQKAPTDVHYDYLVNKGRHQVKRFESNSTNQNFIGVELTKTHGDRTGPGRFYKRNDFDRLIIFDVGFRNFKIIEIKNIPINSQYKDRLPGRFTIQRTSNDILDDFQKELLDVLKTKNKLFPEAIEQFRLKNNWNHQTLLEKICNLPVVEIDRLFSEDNFRLVIGAKGFAAEEHLAILLKKSNIPYHHDKSMYSKVDFWVRNKIRVQVKIPHERSTDSEYWGIKTHKSHGHGKGELFKADEFDIIALFIGFEMDKNYSKYFPKKVSTKFIFIPVSDLERHPDFPGYLKRISKIKKTLYNINDISIFK
jgi:hypothetical protein